MTASRLLMIDDEPDIGELVRKVAEGVGYDMQFVTQANSFKASYRSFKPDVVILDLSMPGTDGIELMEFLAEEKSRARVVILSGFDVRVRDGICRLGEDRGLNMVEFISKPVRIAELRNILGGLKNKDD
jgi:CheY-like chemotaxis protein